MDCNANKAFCAELSGDETGARYYGDSKELSERSSGQRLVASEFRDLAEEVLDTLPAVDEIDDEVYSRVRLKLEDEEESAAPWLIHFVFGDDGVSREEKKLPTLLREADIRYGRMNCEDHAKVCREILVRKPIYAAFKRGGGYEFHFGRDDPVDVATFARAAAEAPNMKTLLADNFPEAISSSSGPVFIDFFAPWCPPCLNLLPEYRKAATKVGIQLLIEVEG